MERRRQVNIILPDYLIGTFYDEVEKLKDAGQSNAKTKLVIKALAKHLNVDIPKVEHKHPRTTDPVITRKSVKVEDLSSRMEMNQNYNIADLINLTGLSRTTVRNLIEDNPTWFATDGPWREKFYLKKEVTRPKQTQERKKKRKRKGKTKPNVEVVSISGPKLKTYTIEEPADKFNEAMTVTYVDEGKGDDNRILGKISYDDLDNYRILREENLITQGQFSTLRLGNYHEDPEYWIDVYKGDTDKINLRLSQLKELQDKVAKLLKP